MLIQNIQVQLRETSIEMKLNWRQKDTELLRFNFTKTKKFVITKDKTLPIQIYLGIIQLVLYNELFATVN